MKDLFYFFRKLRRVAGFRLYINMCMTLFISLLDGIGIYLIVPLLSIIGVFQTNMDGIPLISSLLTQIKSWFAGISGIIFLALQLVAFLILGGEF